jgi:hypothetical protein
MVLDSAGTQGAWFRSPMGRTLAVGGALALAAVLLSMVVSMPAGRRMGKISAEAQKRGA